MSARNGRGGLRRLGGRLLQQRGAGSRVLREERQRDLFLPSERHPSRFRPRTRRGAFPEPQVEPRSDWRCRAVRQGRQHLARVVLKEQDRGVEAEFAAHGIEHAVDDPADIARSGYQIRDAPHRGAIRLRPGRNAYPRYGDSEPSQCCAARQIRQPMPCAVENLSHIRQETFSFAQLICSWTTSGSCSLPKGCRSNLP